MYNRHAGALIGMTTCESNESLASASVNGSIFVMRIETSSSKMSVQHSRQLDIQEDGCAVDINYLDSGKMKEFKMQCQLSVFVIIFLNFCFQAHNQF